MIATFLKVQNNFEYIFMNADPHGLKAIYILEMDTVGFVQFSNILMLEI